MKKQLLRKFVLATIILFAIMSCTTVRIQDEISSAQNVSPYLMDKGVKNPDQLYAFFISHNPGPEADRAKRLADLYIQECALEGVNSDVAFVQMCLETGFLRFGNLVTADMNNFCGLGAIDAQNPGLRFETEQLGVRAHVQHLKAYGSPEPLNMPLIDPRYKYVNPKGKAPTVDGLAGTWAADRQYGEKLNGLLQKLQIF